MITFADLPRELRQEILLDAVQQDDRLTGGEHKKFILALLVSCKVVRSDMPWVLENWQPLWYLQAPSDIAARRSYTIDGIQYGPKLDRLCISVFNEINVKNLRSAESGWLFPHVLHPELVEAWSNAAPRLPPGIKTILLDITPAPGWMRKKGSNSRNSLVREKRTAKQFMNAHIDDVSKLVGCLHEHYAGNVTISLTGTLSDRNHEFVRHVQQLCTRNGISVQYLGEYVSIEDMVHLADLVRTIAPKESHDEHWQRALRKVWWSGKSSTLFRRICDEDGVHAVNAVEEELQKMAKLMAGERGAHLETSPCGNLHRALIHGLAEDMGLSTVSEGVGEDRHVVVTK